MKYQVWYMRPEFFVDCSRGTRQPDKRNLGATHIHLKDMDSGEHGLEFVYAQMQAEVWSPNGEARDKIESRGLRHTSMSVGDVIVDEIGNAYVVANVGFKEIE
jgi:hypothetical protein